MKRLALSLLFTVLALPLLAQDHPVPAFWEICSGELIPGWLPVGCEVIDCCPGCPGGGELILTLEGDPGDRLTVDLAGAAPSLKAGGSAEVSGNRLVIRPGRATIGGFPRTALGKIFGAARFSGKGPLAGMVEYRSGGKIVGRRDFAYRFIDCSGRPGLGTGGVSPAPSASDAVTCPAACGRVIRFMTDHEIPASVGISTGSYRDVSGFDYLNVFVEFSQATASELPVDLGIMFAFDAAGRMGSRRYVNLESNVASPQQTNFISVSGANSWHGAQGISSYTIRIPVMGPFAQVFVYNTSPFARRVSVWGYLSR